MPDFLDIDNIPYEELRGILSLANKMKNRLKNGEVQAPLIGKQLAMIFEKPSTRTRTSFEVGINQLGGNSIILNTNDSQLGRGEPISDTAQVLSRYVDIIMIRCFSHDTLLQLAQHSTAPVINGLTDISHPCQVMADIMTFEENKGTIKDKKVAWVGDANNVTTSWVHAAVRLGFELHISTPEELKPKQELSKWAQDNNGKVFWTQNPEEAVKNADLITTDTWVSMGDKDAQKRIKLLTPYQVNSDIMKLAKPDALFMHCLPAHREEEVTSEVIDGKQSVIYQEAENRLHIQKAIIIWCLKKTP
jgi:ornithine carbamoyltransferase